VQLQLALIARQIEPLRQLANQFDPASREPGDAPQPSATAPAG